MVMKVYSREFKADAVALYLSDPGHTYEGVGKDLGISRETLRNWVRTHRARSGEDPVTSTRTKDGKTVVKAATREELEAELAAVRAELKQTRKELQKVGTERDILRKATKFFASEMSW